MTTTQPYIDSLIDNLPAHSEGVTQFDADFLERVALVSFQKLILASGELIFPSDATLLDEQMALLQNLMEALGQRPPATVLAQWRQLIEQKLQEVAPSQPQTRLRVAFSPAEKLMGLTGGFRLGIATIASEHWPDSEAVAGENNRDRLLRQTLAQGTLTLAAIPSLIDQHLRQIRRLLEGLGQQISEAEMEEWRGAIAPTLQQLFQQSPNAYLVVRFRVLNPADGLQSGIALDISGEITSVEAEYHAWTHTRTGPLFGSHADAKVLDVAAQLSGSLPGPILDIGAGTGRNSLALAHQRLVVDAIELAPALAAQLNQAKTAAGLSLNVIQGNILDPQLALPHQQYSLIFLSEVIASHFRSVAEVRQLFVCLSDLLQPGGVLLFNAFLATDGYHPTPAVRELAQAFWSCVFTPAEIAQAMSGLPLQLISNEPAAAYEQAHLPAIAWPPTDWFLGWATGRNLFPTIEQPPIELRWLAYSNLNV